MPDEEAVILSVDAASNLRGYGQPRESTVDGDGLDGRRARSSARLPSAKVQKHDGEEELGMAQMVRIGGGEQAPKDRDSVKCKRYLLTLMTQDVELGWRVR
jgi:hypothetical protein